MACDDISKRPKKPDNLISKDQMAELLYDLHIINAAKGVNRKTLENNGFNPETYILTQYNVDSTQFADSNTYYAFNPEVYKTIVDNVKARLEAEKKMFEDINKIEEDSIKRHRDSIKRHRDSINKPFKKRKDSIKKSLDSISLNKLKPEGLLGKVDSLR